MENFREYIESGILELYVLGDVSAEERAMVEELAANHPEIRAEIEDIERSLEFYAEMHAVEPSGALRGKVMNSLLTNLGDDRVFTKPSKHTNEQRYSPDEVPESVDNVRVLPARSGSFYKYAFAACFTLLLISIAGIISLSNQLKESNTQLTALQLDKQKIANQVNYMDEELGMYRNPVFKVLRLKGTAKVPNSALTLAWNTSNKKIMLDVQGMNLPEHDRQHQYQLWALVSGKPVDLGVFDAPDSIAIPAVKEMKAIAAADAFAVTIEPMGGSVNPTLDQMVVQGIAN